MRRRRDESDRFNSQTDAGRPASTKLTSHSRTGVESVVPNAVTCSHSRRRNYLLGSHTVAGHSLWRARLKQSSHACYFEVERYLLPVSAEICSW